jgi:serine/threonine-protein kinase
LTESGDSLSHFRLIERIGEGGMGAVWKALDTRLDREVALKILPESLAGDPEKLARFESEAKAVAALNHPNIVTIHSVEEAEGKHFFTMELVDGKTLTELIPENGFKIERLLDLAIPIADAIRAAHEQGVSHRDLKPANVMVDSEDRVKILDFGLARVIEEGESRRDRDDVPTETLPHDREILGTMPYMAPEQLQGKPVDQRSDIFATGAVLHEMATGKRPFEGETSADLIASILRDEALPVTKLNPGLPRQFERIVGRCIKKEPKRRFQTALDLYNELQQLKEELQSGRAGQTRPVGAARDIKSIAVLPLENLSEDPEQEFFADGMTDALITDLAKIGALKVISRTSIMQYKKTRKPLSEVARELGVDAIVEGTVQRAGDRVRIIAQLIDAATDEHLWAERYDRELRDVLALQSEVTHAIAQSIHVKITDREHEALNQVATVNPEAHEACLKGRYFWYKRTSEGVKKGLEYFEEALRHDPNYAQAHAGMADCYLVDGGGYLGVAPDEAYTKAREAALKALAIDDQLAEVHTSLAAMMDDYEWNWDGAEEAYRRAIELNSNYVTAHHWYADHLARMGRHDEAIREARLARNMDPLSRVSTFIQAWVHFFARRYPEAIRLATRTLDLDPEYVAAYRVLGWANEQMAHFDDAIEAHRRAASLSGDSPVFKGQLGRAFAMAGRRDEATALIDELIAASETTRVSSHDIAVTYGALGEKDRAIEWLEKAVAEHAEHVPYLKVNPRLDVLRSNPRFKAILVLLALTD